jgi:hypothetical protein
MIESKCPNCGGKKVDPDPPPKTKEQNIQFRKDWDARYDDSLEYDETKDDRPCLMCLEKGCRGGCID